MLRLRKTCEENYERFIRRVVDGRKVYYLRYSNGPAVCESYDYEDAEVILFFSDAAYARRAQTQSMPETEVDEIDLFDFLYRWLPGMTGDGVLAGPNWTGDLVGLELEAYPLREAVEEAMSEDHLAEYDDRCRRLMEAEQENGEGR